jgi:hypothetical protein
VLRISSGTGFSHPTVMSLMMIASGFDGYVLPETL